MKFTKYSSIENVTRTKTMEQIQLDAIPTHDWVANEKLHGSNFSVWFDGSEVKFAKRSGFIGGNESFYNHDRIATELSEKIKEAYKDEKLKEIDEIAIFGELCGGSYNHPDVPRVNIKSIQKGIQYHPDVKFVAFDLKFNGILQSYDWFRSFCDKYGFDRAPEMCRGSLEECLKYPNEFQSYVPAMFGLPAIENNICEGTVIKPVQPQFFGNGERVILKNKNEKWSEKSSEKKEPKVKVELSSSGRETLSVLIQYITENRLKNVISKVGEVTTKDFGKILGLFCKDVWEDFKKNEIYPELPDVEMKMIKKLMNSEASNLIRPNFRDMIDGTF